MHLLLGSSASIMGRDEIIFMLHAFLQVALPVVCTQL